MNPKFRLLPSLAMCQALLLLAGVRPATAALPVSGRPVPALTQLDTTMDNFMSDSGRTISAGVLGVSRGGRVVYLRAFGSLSPGVNLPETALFRLASVAKPITAAAVHRFSQAGGFGATNLQRRIFNLSGNGGVLNISPPAAVDANAQNITIGHLLNHSGGWDRSQANPGDIPFRARAIGIAMNEPDALPSRGQVIDWAMQFPLNYAPGAATYTPATPAGAAAVVPGGGSTYSNFGYLLLGEALEAIAPGGYLGYLSTDVLSVRNWIPFSEWGPARTRQTDVSSREPVYDHGGAASSNSVFDYTAPIEQLPPTYGGGVHIETMLAHGGLIASAQAMLRFGNLFNSSGATTGAGATQANNIGQAVPTTGLQAGDWSHTGSLPGCNTILRQISNGAGAEDDVVIYIAFNERSSNLTVDWASLASNEVVTVLNSLSTTVPPTPWPTEACDGFWVTVGTENSLAGRGGYHSPWQGFQSALVRAGTGSYLRLRPGTQNWTGTIGGPVRLDAPEGPVTIGPP